MQADRFTVKSQEAVSAAQQLAARFRNTEVVPAHLLLALLEQEDGFASAALRKLSADVAAITDRARERGRRAAGRRWRPKPPRSAPPRASSRSFSAPRREMAARGDEYISVGHLLLALADKASGVADLLPDRDSLVTRRRRDPGPEPGHLPQPRGDGRGAGEVRPRPDRRRRAGQARPGDRPRRGDPPGDPGALAPDQEQPRPDRRARRRQDGDRRGPRPADRRRRRARVACATAA